MDHVKRLVASAKRKGDARLAGTYVSIATAGVWTQERRRLAGYATEGRCLRCKRGAQEDEKHCIWTCECNGQFPAARGTRHLEAVAKAECEECPVFWLRGLVPLTMLPVIPACRDQQWQQEFEGNSCTASCTGSIDNRGTKLASGPLVA